MLVVRDWMEIVGGRFMKFGLGYGFGVVLLGVIVEESGQGLRAGSFLLSESAKNSSV